MTDEAAPAQLAADRPITTKAQDCPHYQAFAGALARSIVERAPSDGFVIGVQAQWAVGKSSAINLTLEAIRKLQEGVPEGRHLKVRPFEPWLFSGLETLAAAYVSEPARVIDETLGESDRGHRGGLVGAPPSAERIIQACSQFRRLRHPARA